MTYLPGEAWMVKGLAGTNGREAAASVAGSEACSTLHSLAQTEHYVIRLDPRCKLVVAQRTPTGFEQPQEIEACFRRLDEVLVDVPRDRYMLVVDTRAGPSRNDPAFEAVFAMHHRKLVAGFVRLAALVATAGGRLQIQRLAKAEGHPVFATDSAAAAFEYLGLPAHSL